MGQVVQRAGATPVGRWLQAHRAISIPAAVVAGLGLAFGLGRHSGTATAPGADNAPLVRTDGRGIAVGEQQLQRSGLALIRPELSTTSERPIAGFVEPAVGARAHVGMPVAGRLMRLLVAPGSSVGVGAVIAEVRSPEAAVVRADVEAARAAAQSLALQYRRAVPMANQGALAWQELESRRVASIKASSEARAAMAKAMAIGSPDSTGRLLLRSPISGQVAVVHGSPGAVLQAGAEVVEIADVRGSELRLLVSPLLGANLQPAQVLRVKAGPRQLRARIVGIAPDAGSANRVMVVRAVALDAALPPAGTAVTAFVMVPATDRRFTVPTDAVQLLNGNPVVFRYQRGMVEPVPVVLAEPLSGRVVVRQGLRGNEWLLGGNTASLRAALEARRPWP